MVRNPSPITTSTSSSSWRIYKEEGSSHFNEGHYEHALASYRAALHPQYHIPNAEKQIILSNIVATRLKIGTKAMAEAAITDAKQCIALNDRWPKGHVRLASAYIALGGHSNDACNCLQRAVMLEPSNTVARQMLLQELRRDRESRNEGGGGGGGSGVAPSAPPLEEVIHADASGVTSTYGDAVGVDDDDDVQPPAFNPNSFSFSDGADAAPNDYMGSPTAPFHSTSSAPPPPPNDYMGSPTAPPPRPAATEDTIDDSPSLSQRINFYMIQWTSWYHNTLSDDAKTLTKVLLGILVLYIAFGGRFGMENVLSSQPRGNRGNYERGNAYDQYYRRDASTGGRYNSGNNDRSSGNYASSSYSTGDSSSYSSSSSSQRYNNHGRPINSYSGYNDGRNTDTTYNSQTYSSYDTYTNPRHTSSSSSNRFSSNSYHFPNIFDGSVASMMILLGIGFICHHFSINPFQVFMLLNMANRRVAGRNRYGYGGMAGGMGGMGMGYGMANHFYRRGGFGGRRRG